MSIPEGVNQTPPQDEEESEQVILIPVGSLSSTIEKATRRGRRGRAADFVDESQWFDAAVLPYLQKFVDKINNVQTPKEEEK